MPVFRAGEHPSFSQPIAQGVLVVGLATPSGGATETVLCRVHMDPGAAIAPHRHDHEEVMAVLEGSVRLGGDEGEAELGPGDSAVIPPGTRHAPVAGEDGALLVTAMPVGMRILPDEGEPRVAPWAG